MNYGLRTKIIAWSFVPTTIILVAVAVVIFYAYQQVTEDLVIERNRELIRLAAGQLATELAEYTDVLVAVARNADISHYNPAAQRAALKRVSNRLVVFDGGVLILDPFGTVVASEPERPEVLGQDWSDRSYFRQMIRTPRPFFSSIVADGPQGAEVVVAAVPITGDLGEFLGAMVGMFRLDATAVSAFYGAIVKLRIGQGGSTYLVDGNGRVIYHSDTDRIGEDISTQAMVQPVLRREVGAIRTHDSDGQDIVASFAPVSGTPWGLVTEEHWTTLTRGYRGYQQFLLLLLVLGVVVPALVVTVGVGRITRPIAELIGAAQEVAKGHFGQKITAPTGDELEELAEQFNLMSAQLQESYAHLERRVADRTKELAGLNAIAAVVSRSLDLEEILNDALDKTLEVTGIEAGGIYLLEEKTGVLTVAAQRGFSPQVVAEINELKVGEGFSGRVAQSGQPLVVRNVSTDPRLTRMVIREEGFRSVAIFPLSSKGKVLGTLFAATHGYREFTDQDVQLLNSIGHQIGVAIENARLFEAEGRRAEQFRVISEVGRRITSILAVDELLEEIARLLKETLGYYLVGISLIEGDELIFKAGAGGVWETPGFQPPRLKVGQEGITGWVAHSGEPLLVPDVSQEPRYYSLPQASEIRSELAVPLKTKEAVIGVLHVQSDHLNAFDESDLTVLQSLAHQAAIAIENARLYEQAQQVATLEERQRLARELHDSVTQALYGVTLYAEAAARLLLSGDVEMAADHLRELRDTAQEALREMRLLIFELRPPVLQTEGLVAALQARLEAVEERARLKTEFKVEGEGHLRPEVEEELYRIAQEALNNALKHAQAGRITVSLRQVQRTVILEIADDGIGFDPTTVRERGGLGLHGMEERAAQLGGRLAVTSKPGEGTRVRVEVSQ